MKLRLLLFALIFLQLTIVHASNQYLGCFIDQIGNRDLNIFIGDYEQLTPKECIRACEQENYLYAAIQYGNECRCGQQFGKYGQVSNDECHYVCLTTEKCGGDYRNSVYKVVRSNDIDPIEKQVRDVSNDTSNSTTTTTLTTTSSTTTGSTLTTTTATTTSSTTTGTTTTATTTSSTITGTTSTTTITATTTSSTTITSSITTTGTTSTTTTTATTASSTTTGSTPTTTTVTTTSSTTTGSTLTTTTATTASSTTTVSTPTTTTITTTSSTTTGTTTTATTASSTTTGSTSTTTTITTTSSTTTGSTSTTTTTLLTTSSSTSTITTVTSTTTLSSTSTTTITSSTSTTVTSSTSTSTTTTITSSISTTATSSTMTTTTVTSTTTSSTSTTTTLSTSTSTTTTVTTSTTTTTNINQTTTITPSSSFWIYTILLVNPNENFTAGDSATRERVRARLTAVINRGFFCLNDPTSSNCTASSRRRKRQCSGHNVVLLNNIAELASTSSGRRYLVNYYVTSACNPNSFTSPTDVRTAVDRLTDNQIRETLGYNFEGDIVRSTSTDSTDGTPTDRKLWIIGAVLGPVAFFLLLVCSFCYLHYKCRPRPTNRTLAKTIANAPPVSARSTNYQTMVNDTPAVEKTIQVLAQNDPLVSASLPSQRATPIETEKPLQTELSMDEIRRQNDVERWRNKLRLQEKFQRSTTPNVNPYENQAYEQDPMQINLQPLTDIPADQSPRPTPKTYQVEAGRTKLHRLLDDVLDKADAEQIYNPDSESERQKRRRQRRRIHSISNETKTLPLNPQIPHIPVIPQVIERPDSNLVQLRYNPYEAGDRAHAISSLPPVEFKTKYPYDEQQSNPYSARSNPPLFADDTNLPDRAATATNAYANPKRLGKTRLETDREAVMRHDDALYLDARPRHSSDYRVQARTVWVEPETDNDSFTRNDYLNAKRSIANTKTIISSIHNNLQHITLPQEDEYQA